MAARRGEVRLRVHKAHDARGLAADAGLGDVVAAGDDKMEQQRRWTQVIQTLFSSVDFRYIY